MYGGQFFLEHVPLFDMMSSKNVKFQSRTTKLFNSKIFEANQVYLKNSRLKMKKNICHIQVWMTYPPDRYEQKETDR